MAGVKIKECGKCPNARREIPCDYAVDIRKEARSILSGVIFEHKCPVYASIFKPGDLVNIILLNLQGVVVAYYYPYYYVYTHRAFRGMNQRFTYTIKCSANDLQLLKARQADSQQILFNLIREYELDNKMEETDIFHQINETIQNDISRTKKKVANQLKQLVTPEPIKGEIIEQQIQDYEPVPFSHRVDKVDRIFRIKERLSKLSDTGVKS